MSRIEDEVMARLHFSEGRSPRQIAERMAVDVASVQLVLSSLMRQNLVVRDGDPRGSKTINPKYRKARL